MHEEEDSIAANIAEWTETNAAAHRRERASAHGHHEGILWGVFAIPEAQVGALRDVNGLDVVELGCGTAYFGSWLARAGRAPSASTRRRRSSRPRGA